MKDYAYPSKHALCSCIRLCMCYHKPPSPLPGSRTCRNGWSEM